MPIRAECSECGKRVRAKDEAAGRRIKCPDCGTPIRIPATPDDEPPRRKKPAPRKKESYDDDYGGDEYGDDGGDLDFGALADMAGKSAGLGSGQLEPCLNCGREIGGRARECPYCGESPKALKQERREEARRERIRKEKEEEREIRRQLAAAEAADDEGGWGWLIFILIFVVGNGILYATTGWIIIPRR